VLAPTQAAFARFCEGESPAEDASQHRPGVYLEVSRPVEVSSLSEEMPEPVQTCLHEVERELGSGNSKSVGKVVISWDEMSFLGTPPGLVLMAFRRRTVSRDHRSPRSVPH